MNDTYAMSKREEKLLIVLVCMARQYLAFKTKEGREALDSAAMGAGEEAILLLKEYGLVELMPGPGRIGAYWTEAGNELWNSRDKYSNKDNIKNG